MKTKSPLTKNEIIKDFKTGNLGIYLFIFLGIIGVGWGIAALFFFPLISLLFIPAFGFFFIYLPLKMLKKDNEDLSSIQNDNFQVIEDRILKKDHTITSHKDKDGDLDYLRKYWKVLTSWNQFLVDNGKEPGNQLCTDDFKGSSKRNANLAVKAIMGIASFAEMCKMLGYDDLYEKHMATAREYAHYWVDMDRSKDGTWYYMEFQNSTHWGLKYNMLWDKLWGWNIFNDDYTGDVMGVEIPFYLKKIKKYGLPLDSRDNSCKSDWNAWVAAMTTKEADFNAIMDTEWRFANETTSRWPLSDWHQTENASAVAFRGRSVIGGLWAKVLVEKNAGNLPDGIEGIQEGVSRSNAKTELGRYNLSGQQTKKGEKGIQIVRYSDGTSRKVLIK